MLWQFPTSNFDIIIRSVSNRIQNILYITRIYTHVRKYRSPEHNVHIHHRWAYLPLENVNRPKPNCTININSCDASSYAYACCSIVGFHGNVSAEWFIHRGWNTRQHPSPEQKMKSNHPHTSRPKGFVSLMRTCHSATPAYANQYFIPSVPRRQ